MEKRVVRLWVETERWRYQCPRDHRSWVPQQKSFYCNQCGIDDEINEAVYSVLVDARTGEEVDREEFHFLGNRYGPPPEDIQSLLTDY